MSVRVAFNGFGRMGRLSLRTVWERCKAGQSAVEVVHINEVAGPVSTAAHLLKYDSVHGQFDEVVEVQNNALVVGGRTMSYSQNHAIEDSDWGAIGVDIVIDCTGQFKTTAALQPYLQQGVKKVVVSAPVKDGPLNIVMGVNDHLYCAKEHDIVTAASCTTNCIAPVVDVIHHSFGVRHACITTIHDITNTQSILDEYHRDLRRARASGLSLIPTSTGSATAITEIFPELKGRINGVAVRVPLANASLTDCVFELEKTVDVLEVNTQLKDAAQGRLRGVLGFEDKPLVSIDYVNDTRSSIVDGPSTMVINGTQLKVLAWYDNEIGYVNRMMELVHKVAAAL